MMDNRLVPIKTKSDVFPEYRDTAIELLLEYQNLKRPFDAYQQAELLVGMCMDNRKHLKIPENFAFIIRSGGGNLRESAFKVSYAIAIGGVKAIALIGHNHCGMVNLEARKQQFIDGLVKQAGWTVGKAAEHFDLAADRYEIGNEVDFVLSEAKRLRKEYPKMLVAPLLYNVEDNALALIREI